VFGGNHFRISVFTNFQNRTETKKRTTMGQKRNSPTTTHEPSAKKQKHNELTKQSTIDYSPYEFMSHTNVVEEMKKMADKRDQWTRNIEQDRESDEKIARIEKELLEMKNNEPGTSSQLQLLEEDEQDYNAMSNYLKNGYAVDSVYSHNELKTLRERWTFPSYTTEQKAWFGLFGSEINSNCNPFGAVLNLRRYMTKNLASLCLQLKDDFDIDYQIDSFVTSQETVSDGVVAYQEKRLTQVDQTMLEIAQQVNRYSGGLTKEMLSNLFLLILRRQVHPRANVIGECTALCWSLLKSLERISHEHRVQNMQHLCQQVQWFYSRMNKEQTIKMSTLLIEFLQTIWHRNNDKNNRLIVMTIYVRMLNSLIDFCAPEMMNQYTLLLLSNKKVLTVEEQQLCQTVNEQLFSTISKIIMCMKGEEHIADHRFLFRNGVSETYLLFRKNNMSRMVHLLCSSVNYLVLVLLMNDRSHNTYYHALFLQSSFVEKTLMGMGKTLSSMYQSLEVQELKCCTDWFEMYLRRYENTIQ
jgi:hypothetical protein